MYLWILLAVFAALLLYAVSLYNALVRIKHEVSRSWANIDVLLKQRHDELPKLVAVCQQYAQFEQATLTRVMEARAAIRTATRGGDIARIGELEGSLRGLLGQIYAVAEAYPELKADQQFALLSERISTLENAIADRRELYNEAVNINNIRIEQFPDVLIAQTMGFAKASPLRFSSQDKADVDIAALFDR
ncbi:LemA family protein [Craterilacuibacter sinensis]|uniref:LemA family protein n=1 Tax=Craterilacuibacter sinensis TaxID=2686017 RepID=A0A845BFP0_9NEIS|nr:LemA family protein [Craterilacuibacter sinensis]MXR35567.1 LemA family protein [Craterilacuibacter sinensis]